MPYKDKEKQKEYYQLNKEKILERVRKYQRNYKGKIRERKRQYYQKNKEKIVKHQKQYIEENREKVKEYRKEYYQKNRDEIVKKNKEWREKNKDRYRQYKKEYGKMYKEKNKEKIKKQNREYYLKNKKRIDKYREKWVKEHPELQKKTKKKSREKVRVAVLKMIAKSEHPVCENCGCDDIRLLEINHINGGGYQDTKGCRGSRFYQKIYKKQRPTDDLNVLCRVCNAEHAMELRYGKLPYKIIYQKGNV
jgi:hypothetical protein